MLIASLLALSLLDVVQVETVDQLREAVSKAVPGTTILLAPGRYEGGWQFSKLNGTAGKPIVIGAVEPKSPPRITGGGSAIQFSNVSYLEIRDLMIQSPKDNGLNIDDGGDVANPSHHVTIRNVRVYELPPGNHDGIKLSGVDDFTVDGCRIDKWGGSGIDMVGCHRGVISNCTLNSGGDSGIQAKGGSTNIKIQKCGFKDFGLRGVNLGGSTAVAYFRPPLDSILPGDRYEAKDLTVEGCTFSGGGAPFAFVGVDGATVRYNTVYHPNKWVIRILQETRSKEFVPSRKGVFEYNLVVFRRAAWSEGGVNIGPDTAASTFKFARNYWYCSDSPYSSRPTLPSDEEAGIYGVDPDLTSPGAVDMGVKAGSQALYVGAHAFPELHRAGGG